MSDPRCPGAGGHKIKIRYVSADDLPADAPMGGLRIGGRFIKATPLDPPGSEFVRMSFRPEEHEYDKEKVDRAWAEIRQAREAAKEAAKKEEEEAKTEKERRMRMNAMVEESEGVAWNIAQAEKAIGEEEECKKEKEADVSIQYEKAVEALDWVFP